MEYRIKGRLTAETFQQYQDFCQAHKLTGRGSVNQALTLLLHPAPAETPAETPADVTIALPTLLDQIGCTADEASTIAGVLEQQGFAWEKFIHDAVMSVAERWAKRQESIANVAEGDVDARRKVKGTAYADVASAVDQLLRENEQAPALEHRRYVSKPLVERLSACSPIIVRKYCADHGARIDQHNRRMGFADPETGRHHNQWVYKPYVSMSGVQANEKSEEKVEEYPVEA